MRDVVIVSAARTAIGKFNGSLAQVPVSDLGATVIRAVLERGHTAPDQVEEVILGQVLTAGEGQNPARQAALKAGVPETAPAMTINKVCGSGLKAVQLAAQAIALGEAEVLVAGGQENMSAAPHLLPHSRRGQAMGDWQAQDSMVADGLTCAINGYHMGITAENLAREYDITRQAQDIFSVASQQKAEAAITQGRFAEEIVPVKVPQRRGEPLVFETDEFPRFGASLESLTRLRPAFDKSGTVTAGNASGINDGAAAVLLMSASRAAELDLKPLATIRAFGRAGVAPEVMGIAPVGATTQCLERAGWQVGELDLIEANEAFAAQSLAVQRVLGWAPERVNVNGGAIALGHPIGASGCRILVTLLHELKRRDGHKGLATLCIGGGMGIAVAVER